MNHPRLHAVLSIVAILFSISATPLLRAADKEDLDAYKLRIDTAWYYINPSGSFRGTNETGTVDIQKDLGFNTYSIFAGKVDRKFTRKNHLYIAISPLNSSHQTVLNRIFTFQGQTFNAGLTTNSSLNTLYVAPSA